MKGAKGTSHLPRAGGKSVATFWIRLSTAGPHPVHRRLIFLGVCTRAAAMSIGIEYWHRVGGGKNII